MLIYLLTIAAGLVLLLWSADRFVAAASGLAARLGMSPLLIGMIVVGFGTSAPEMTVSILAAWQGNPGIALGNAYGSNITNIALILGLTALIRPISVQSVVVRKELPLLIGISLLAGWQLIDGNVSRLDAIILLAVFAVLLAWSIMESRRNPEDSLGGETQESLDLDQKKDSGRSTVWLIGSLLLLIVSSRMLVWGAIEIATVLGVSELIIGLTIVAVGTSLPELASSLVAARRGEHDLAIGNIIGSNLFNTLVVIGLAGLVRPLPVASDLINRDLPVMLGLTVVLLIFGYGFRGPGRINRVEGGFLLAAFVIYTLVLVIYR